MAHFDVAEYLIFTQNIAMYLIIPRPTDQENQNFLKKDLIDLDVFKEAKPILRKQPCSIGLKNSICCNFSP